MDAAAYGQYQRAQPGQCLNYGAAVAAAVAHVAALLVFQVEAAVTLERLYLDYLQEINSQCVQADLLLVLLLTENKEIQVL